MMTNVDSRGLAQVITWSSIQACAFTPRGIGQVSRVCVSIIAESGQGSPVKTRTFSIETFCSLPLRLC